MAHNKYQKLVLQGSNDGVNWVTVTPEQYKKGDLIEEDSVDCGGNGTDTTSYRWTTVEGEYYCVNNDKYTLIKKQYYDTSTSSWKDVTPLETTYGTLIESNSTDCGYGIQWKDTSSWQCSSIEGTYTTTINCYGSGSCLISLGGGNQTYVGGTYYLDTDGSHTIHLEAYQTNSLYLLQSFYFDSSLVGYTSGPYSYEYNVNSADHVASLYFYSKPLWKISCSENCAYILSMPTYAQDGESIEILASSDAQGWGFNYFDVNCYTSSSELISSYLYWSNPLVLTVTSNITVGAHFTNENVQISYTLIFDGESSYEVSGTPYLTEANWYNETTSTWFDFRTLSTVATRSHTLKIISSYCFASHNSYFASHLMSVYFSTVQTVGSSAFMNLPWLVSVSLPSCSIIYNDAFKSCSRLTTVSLPNATELYQRCFMNCTNLSVISLPNATLLYSGCFSGCTNLKKVYLLGGTMCSLSKTVYNQVWNQFSNCPNLEEIIVPGALYRAYKSNWGSYSKFITAY